VLAKTRDLRRAMYDWRRYFSRDALFLATATPPYLVTGAVMLAGARSAPCCVAAAMTASILKSITDAWAVLVEIDC
jgi:hypothetical protein